MGGHHFISYSTADAQGFAVKLADALAAGPPPVPVWLDKRKLQPGADWDDQLVEALKTCETLLFVMTADSVDGKSACKQEWTRALRYKKPVIPLLLDPDVEPPFSLERRQRIDFSGDFEAALAKLRDAPGVAPVAGGRAGESRGSARRRSPGPAASARRAAPCPRSSRRDRPGTTRGRSASARRGSRRCREARRRSRGSRPGAGAPTSTTGRGEP